MPTYRYLIQDKGKVEVGILSCGMCHTRVMSDGTVVKGAQGNFPFGRTFGFDLRSGLVSLEEARLAERLLYWVPWRQELEEHSNVSPRDSRATVSNSAPFADISLAWS